MSKETGRRFISYARTDSGFALRLAGDLRKSGAAVWLDQLDIKAGQRWDQTAEEGLRSCSGILVILSPASVISNNVLDEVSFALEEGKIVIPVLYQDCSVPFRLRRIQYADFRTTYDEGLQQLLKTLNLEKVGKPAGPSVAQGFKGLAFTVADLTRLYNFPPESDGKGQCIGLIELGGGYKDSDLDTYFGHMRLPKPNIVGISVDSAEDRPGDQVQSVQVTADIEVVGSAAPGVRIAVYFTQGTGHGFVRAIQAATQDGVNRPSVLSLSWGETEDGEGRLWNLRIIEEMNVALQAAAEKGITVVAAAGDGGVTDHDPNGKPHVIFPASSPWVLAVGGTRLRAKEGAIQSEVVWNDGGYGTGGGVSVVFPKPPWQANANVPSGPEGRAGRGVPDVAASASPKSGYALFTNGMWQVLGGTSMAAPLWAGLIARLNQALGRRIGHFNPVLYGELGPAGVLRNITQGDNSIGKVKGYSAGPGWNACTGWGSPDGGKLLHAMRSGK
jgi:kumamolisin